MRKQAQRGSNPFKVTQAITDGPGCLISCLPVNPLPPVSPAHIPFGWTCASEESLALEGHRGTGPGPGHRSHTIKAQLCPPVGWLWRSTTPGETGQAADAHLHPSSIHGALLRVSSGAVGPPDGLLSDLLRISQRAWQLGVRGRGLVTRQLQGLGNLAPSCQLSQGSPPKPSPPPLSLASPLPHSLCSVHRSVQRLQFRKVQPAAHLSGRLCGRQPPHAPGPETQEEPQSGQQVGDRVSP